MLIQPFHCISLIFYDICSYMRTFPHKVHYKAIDLNLGSEMSWYEVRAHKNG